MRRYHIAALGLGVLLLSLLALTRFGWYALRGDTVAVELGFEASHSARAQAFDEALLSALERGHFGDELRHRLDRPAHSATIDRLWADTCEVRQIDFERFARQRGDDEGEGAGALFSSSSGHRIAGLLQSPASGVDYAGAAAYCEAAGGRLPWAEEWEALAVGRAGRLYPWGDAFNGDFWPYQDSHRNASQACGAHPAAATPEGVYDLAGNVMEWSSGRRLAASVSRLDGTTETPVTIDRRNSQQADTVKLRPGAHGAPAVRASGRALYALSAAWLEIAPQTRSHHLGFRCVYEQPPPASLPWGATPKAVEIPAGEYALGVPRDLRLARVAVLLPPAQQRTARSLVGKQHARRVKVARCEVSRRDYRAFLRHPLVRFGLFANEHEPRWQDYTPHNWARQLEQPDLPVSGVNWWAADAFARWAGGRLPRVEEWQLLAAGADANPYPWGDHYEPGIAATGDQPNPGAHPCGATTSDRNANGVLDLAGNLSEWTLSITAEQGDYAAWVQGGNWLLPGPTTARSVFGRPVPLNHRSESIGFRVIYD